MKNYYTCRSTFGMLAKKGVSELGEQEHEVLRAVWAHGSCTVREIHERVGVPRGLAYTTVSTVLDRLLKKGFIAKDREGKVLVYRPLRKEHVVERDWMKSLVGKIFGEDPEPAVARLVDAVETIDPELLDRLAKEIENKKRSRRGSR